MLTRIAGWLGRRLAAGAVVCLGFMGTAWALDSLSRNITATSIDQPSLVTFLSNVVTKVNALDASVDSNVTAVTELATDHDADNGHMDDLKTLVNDIRSQLAGDEMMGDGDCAQASSDTTAVDIGAFDFIVNGVMYSEAANTDVALGDTDTTDNGEVAGYAFDIGADGTVDAIAAADNAGGDYADAAAALAALPAVTSDHVRICTLTVAADTGTFVAGTDDPDDANTTATFTDQTTAFAGIASAVSSSAAGDLAASAPTAVSDTDDLTLSRD